jgi:hypothetical protein
LSIIAYRLFAMENAVQTAMTPEILEDRLIDFAVRIIPKTGDKP